MRLLSTVVRGGAAAMWSITTNDAAACNSGEWVVSYLYHIPGVNDTVKYSLVSAPGMGTTAHTTA